MMMGGVGNDTYFVDDAGRRGGRGRRRGQRRGVSPSVNYGLPANVENLILQGIADLQGYGNDQVNVIYGNTGNNLLNGCGRRRPHGRRRRQRYLFRRRHQRRRRSRSPARATTRCFRPAHYGLAADVETLVLQGSADLQGYGNNQANTLYGNTGNNLLNGAGGADTMWAGSATTPTSSTMPAMQWSRTPTKAPMRCFPRSTSSCRPTWKRWCCRAAPMSTAPAMPSPTVIFGNSGDNRLDGQGNADTLTGNAGNDTFVFIVGQGQRRRCRRLRRQRRGGGRFAAVHRLRRGRDLHQHRPHATGR